MLNLLNLVEKMIPSGYIQDIESLVEIIEKLITLAEAIKSNATQE